MWGQSWMARAMVKQASVHDAHKVVPQLRDIRTKGVIRREKKKVLWATVFGYRANYSIFIPIRAAKGNYDTTVRDQKTSVNRYP